MKKWLVLKEVVSLPPKLQYLSRSFLVESIALVLFTGGIILAAGYISFAQGWFFGFGLSLFSALALEFTVFLASRLAPLWGRNIVIMSYYLRIGILALILYFFIPKAGIPFVIATILGMAVLKAGLLLRHIRSFKTNSPKKN